MRGGLHTNNNGRLHYAHEPVGVRHTSQRRVDMDLCPDCKFPGLYLTGQDVAFAGWARAWQAP
eukprot:6421607-Ditylum_brightwellii.AAC.1